MRRFDHQRSGISTRIREKIDLALRTRLPPELPGWRIAFTSLSAGRGGGDFAICHTRNDVSYLALVDVMGHDEGSKFFSYAYAGYVRGAVLAARNDQDPSTILEHLSSQVYSDGLLGKSSLTCCLLKLQHSSNRLEVTSAGHPLPLKIGEDRLETIESGGMMLGLLPHQTYKTTTVKMERGERIALYTDGLIEGSSARSEYIQLESTIKASLLSTRNKDIESSLNTSFGKFLNVTNNSPCDDALLILIDRTSD